MSMESASSVLPRSSAKQKQFARFLLWQHFFKDEGDHASRREKVLPPEWVYLRIE